VLVNSSATRHHWGGALEVVDETARGEHVAARPDHNLQPAVVPAQRRGHCLVEQRHPGVDLAVGHEQQAEVRQGHRVQAVVGRLLCQVAGLLHPGALLGGDGRQVGADQQQPAPHHRVLRVLRGPGRPGQPAARCGVVLEVGEVPDAQIEGDQRSVVVPASLPQEREGVLAVADRGAYVAQPPARPAETVDGVGGLVGGGCGGEPGPRFLPASGRGGGTRGVQAVGLRHLSMIAAGTGP